MELYGLNSIGLQRAGLPGRDRRRAQARLPALLQLRPQPLPGARARPQRPARRCREVEHFLAFVESSRAGRAGVSAALPVGVIGVGALGRHHARHLARPARRPAGRRLRPRRERAARGRGRARDPRLRDLDGLLRRVEAVTIAVPTPAHAEVGLEALAARRPGADGEAARRHARRGRRADRRPRAARGVQLQVGHIERYNRALRAAEPYLDGPRYIESQRLAPVPAPGHRRGRGARPDDPRPRPGAAPHRRRGRRPRCGRRASRCSPPTSTSPTRGSNSPTARWRSPPRSRVSRERIRRLRLFQPNGYFSLDLAERRRRVHAAPGGTGARAPGRSCSDVVERIVLEAPEADALRLELQSFVHAVQGDREVVVGGEEGRAALALALRVADAVRTSPLAVPAAG